MTTEKLQLACLTCGYDVAGLEKPVCPECGRAFTDVDTPAMVRLRRILDRGDAFPRKHVLGWAAVIAVYALGAEIMNVEGHMPALVLSAILLSIACFGSLALGSVAVLGCERPRRLAAQDAWRRELWALHLPWLILAPASIVLLAVSIAFMAAGLGLEATLWAGAPILAAWLLCTLAAPFLFLRRVRRRLAAVDADARLIRLRLLIAALCVLVFTAFIGFGGGLVARYGAATMAGYGDPPPDGF
ncbi:MAG: hypothetical protein ACTS27_05770 [Phycisphaerales bacterium]